MKRLHKLAALVMATALIFAMSITASAAGFGYSWDETYSGGSSIEGTFDGTAAGAAFSNVQPGDSFTLTATIHNTSDSATDWYLQNSVLQTLKDASNSGSAAYSYVLSYNGKTIYDSANVGAGDSTGLKDATKDISGSVMYLDTLKSGGSGVLTLTVKFDGSTIDNEYMDTAAKLSLAFQTEKAAEQTVLHTGNIVEENQVITKNGVLGAKHVKTGDTSMLLLFSILGMISGAVLLVLFVVLIRRNRKEGEA